MSDGGGAFIFLQIFQKRGVYYAENKIGIHRIYRHHRLDDGLPHDLIQYRSGQRHLRQRHLLDGAQDHVDGVHPHLPLRLLPFQSRGQVLRLPTEFHHGAAAAAVPGRPLARKLFRMLFRRVNGPEEAKVERELLEEGIAE